MCLEKHEDGDTHIHVLFQISSHSKSFYTRNINVILKDCFGKHGNVITKIRSYEDTLKYLSKDGNFVDIGELPLPKEKRETPSSKFVTAVKNGLTFSEICKDPENVAVAANCAGKLPSYSMLSSIFHPAVVRPNLRLIWISGPSGCGKSYLARVTFPNKV